MRIGIDIDGVIADSLTTWMANLNAHFGQNKKIEDFIIYQFEKVYNVPWPDMDRFFRENQGKLLTGLQPIAGAKEVIKWLKEEHIVVLITARPEEFEEITRAWLAEQGIVYDHLIMTNFQDKRDYCWELGIELFIDDSLENAISISRLNIPVLLYNAPYNQGELPPEIIRQSDWQEISVTLKAGLLKGKQK